MNKKFNLNTFIGGITGRSKSYFLKDIKKNNKVLEQRINGKSVLVIGGAGTIGASFVKAILHFKPERVFVVDINENGLTELVRDVRSSVGLNVPKDFVTYPINFGDKVFKKIFINEGPFDIVANFAAHKHVRSEKDHYSIEAMIDNNVLKAKELLDLLVEYPPQHFFCVSTDKAANPVNVMGASKKLMEDVIMAYSGVLKISTARFANVAFSNGSLPFGFIERIMKKQPLSSPSDVKRFFVSPEESGQLCMLACMLGQSGEIFFPKLDPEKDLKPFTLIANNLLKTIGYEPDECVSEQEAKEKALLLNQRSKKYPVYYFKSDTSGEKPYEEFFTAQEDLDLERFEALGVVKNTPKKSIEEINTIFNQFYTLFDDAQLDKQKVVQLLTEVIGNFEHIETGKSLDQKM